MAVNHADIIRRNGLNKLAWVFIRDLSHSMIVRHRITCEVKGIGK